MSVELQLDSNGLIPAIAQDADSGEVLMLGYVSPDSLRRTLDGDTLWFYSSSRQELWHKGEVSGSYLHVRWDVDCAHAHFPGFADRASELNSGGLTEGTDRERPWIRGAPALERGESIPLGVAGFGSTFDRPV